MTKEQANKWIEALCESHRLGLLSDDDFATWLQRTCAEKKAAEQTETAEA